MGSDGKAVIREDPGDDEVPLGDHHSGPRELHLNYNQSRGQLTFDSSAKDWTLRFLSLMRVPASLLVSVNGEAVPNVQATLEKHADFPGLVLHIPRLAGGNATVVIDLGENPQLGDVDITNRIHDFLMDFQMDMGLKDKIWSVVQSSRPTAVKVGQLETMDLDEELLGPVMELLLADSR